METHRYNGRSLFAPSGVRFQAARLDAASNPLNHLTYEKPSIAELVTSLL